MSRTAISTGFMVNGRTATDTLLDACDDLTNWAIDDTTYPNSAIALSSLHNTEGNNSIYISVDAGENRARVDVTGLNWDCRDVGGIALKIGFDVTPDSRSRLCKIALLIGTSAGQAFINNNILQSADKPEDDLIILKFNATDFTSTAGTFDPLQSIITMMRIQLIPTDGAAYSMYIDGIYAYPRSRSKALLSVDDGPSDTWDFLRALTNSNNVPTTQFVNGSTIGGSGKMTVPQLTTLKGEGHLIANHGYAHVVGLDTLSKADQLSDIQTNIDWLNNNGFEEGSLYFAYVFGAYNDNTHEVLADVGMIMARTVWAGAGLFERDGGSNSLIGNESKWYYRAITLGQGVGRKNNFADVKASIDLAVAYGDNISLYGHKFTAGAPVAADEFAQSEMVLVVEYIKLLMDRGLIEALTWKDYIEGVNTPVKRLGK